ncbi:intracellular septation protein [Legionella beliardensis]|uniref:Inner membrane-spanning protein YciB n=1 Tax=Legionella beliardensis TaxID=91822 RepID=A0A378I310_9GAMM|nr:septation protein A [Legionella beliardensis]STX29066.1 intracellular septation protein [Legionella beliardensis]
MKILFDFFPVFLFFIGYKLFDIYVATAIAMVASLLQVILFRLKHQRYEKMHLFSLAIILILGSATLFFHDPWFIKWKPTGIYWLTALVFLFSPVITQKPLIQKIMDGNINLPKKIWFRLNYAWSLFFILMGAVNIYVAYHYSTNTWVNFKLFGGAGLTLLFVFLQALYLTRHVLDKEKEPQASDSSQRLL